MMKNSYQQIIEKVEKELIEKLDKDKEKFPDNIIPDEFRDKFSDKQLHLEDMMNQQQQQQIVPFIIHKNIPPNRIKQIIKPKLEKISNDIKYARKSIKIFSYFWIASIISFITLVMLSLFIFQQTLDLLGFLGFGLLQVITLLFFIRMRNKMSKNLEAYLRLKSRTQIAEIKKSSLVNESSSFMLRAGTIRGFLMVVISIVTIFYVLSVSIVPLNFIIALNIILLYYEIKPEEVLPTKFVSKIPEKYGTIDRMPRVSNAIEDIKLKLNKINKEVDKILEDIENKFTVIIDKAEKSIKVLNKETQQKVDKLDKNLDKFSEVVDNYVIKGKSFVEQLGLFFLLILVALLSLWVINESADPFDTISISFAAILAAVSIASGLNIQEMMVNKLKNKLNESFELVINGIDQVKSSFLDTFEEIKKKKDDTIKKAQNMLDEFLASNVLIYFPKDIVAGFSINFMVCIVSIMFIFPIFLSNDVFLIAIEFIIGYYFLTKK